MTEPGIPIYRRATDDESDRDAMRIQQDAVDAVDAFKRYTSEESRDLLDFALTEQFTRWMRLKFTVKDILAQDKVLTFGNSGSVWESVNAGTTYALSLSFSL